MRACVWSTLVLIAHNKSTPTYQEFSNKDGSEIDFKNKQMDAQPALMQHVTLSVLTRVIALCAYRFLNKTVIMEQNPSSPITCIQGVTF